MDLSPCSESGFFLSSLIIFISMRRTRKSSPRKKDTKDFYVLRVNIINKYFFLTILDS